MTHPGPLAPPCRTCLYWKRRGWVAGSCWLPATADTRVLEHDTCPHHRPKVIPAGLPPPPPRHATGFVQPADF